MAIVNTDQQFLYARESCTRTCIYKTAGIKLSERDLGILSSLFSLATPVDAFDMIIKVSLIVYLSAVIGSFCKHKLRIQKLSLP